MLQKTLIQILVTNLRLKFINQCYHENPYKTDFFGFTYDSMAVRIYKLYCKALYH